MKRFRIVLNKKTRIPYIQYQENFLWRDFKMNEEVLEFDFYVDAKKVVDKLELIETVKHHAIQIWTYLSKHDVKKREACAFLGINEYLHYSDCPCCYLYKWRMCSGCPLAEDKNCLTLGSVYDLWKNGETRKKRKIAAKRVLKLLKTKEWEVYI